VEAVILAGGSGTRVRDLTAGPKCLLEVGGRAILDILVDELRRQGVSEVIIAAGYRAEEVREHVARVYGGQSVHVITEPTPQGTGGAIAFVLRRLGGQFLVVNGDTLFDADIQGMVAYHRAHEHYWVTMGLVRDSRGDAGEVRVVGSVPGAVIDFVEKASSGSGDKWVNSGIYVMRSSAIYAAPSPPCSLEYQVLPSLVAAGRVAGYPVNAAFDVGTVERYQNVNRAWPGL